MNISTPLYSPDQNHVYDLVFAPTHHGWRFSVTRPNSDDVVAFIDFNHRECAQLAVLLNTAKGV